MVTAALVVAGTLGVASAESPTTATPVRSVSVGGVGQAPITVEANAAAADAAYRQALAAAVADGKGKAEFLAGQAGATLAAVQSITEGGGYVQCTSPESNYVEYRGAQPDFGYSSGFAVGAASTTSNASPPGTPVPVVKTAPPKKKKKHKRTTGKKAAAVSCVVSAQISLSYALS